MHPESRVFDTKLSCDHHLLPGVAGPSVHLQARGLKVHQQSTKLKKGRVLGSPWLSSIG